MYASPAEVVNYERVRCDSTRYLCLGTSWPLIITTFIRKRYCAQLPCFGDLEELPIVTAWRADREK